MREQLLKRYERTNRLFVDLLQELTESHLDSKLGNLPSNKIGQQYWCVIGARNSYLSAAKAGKWVGFSCPLNWNETKNISAISNQLSVTMDGITEFLNGCEKLSSEQIDFFLDLLEHETQHHGQLIRYIYGNKIPVPQSWKSRYSLD